MVLILRRLSVITTGVLFRNLGKGCRQPGLRRKWHRSRARCNPRSHAVCQVVHVRQGATEEEAVNKGGGEGVGGADGVFDRDTEPRMFVGGVSIVEQAAVSSPSYAHQLEIKFLEELAAEGEGISGVDGQQCSDPWHLFVVEFDYVCPSKRFSDDFSSVERPTEINVEDPQGFGTGCVQKTQDSVAGSLPPLRERAKTDRIPRLRHRLPEIVPA